ncbi:hypothetical protein KBB89_03675, partial [Candidatus Gracilibacteria bacterium]|nr:hypothetical protein [Candidatus Gracilibacteria bacterium]
MPPIKKTKKTDKPNIIEEVQLDTIVVDEPKKIIPRTPNFRDEEDMSWNTSKKNKNAYDDGGFEEDTEEEEEEEEEESETFFREKGPKSQGSRLNVDREK